MRMGLFSHYMAIIACGFLAMGISVSGCTLHEEAGSRYDYEVNIKGLDNCSGVNVTEILVPVPMRNGTTLFDNTNISNEKYDKSVNWSEQIVDTQYGKMLSFNTSGPTLNNIRFSMSHNLVSRNAPMSERKKASREIMSSPLSPISIGTAGKYTTWSAHSKQNGTMYSNISYIYIDNSIKSDNASEPLSIHIFLGIVEGSPDISTGYGNTYTITINETIPANVRGWIPVTVQY